MLEKVARSDQLEERLIEFAAKIIGMAGKLCNTFQGRRFAAGIRRCSLLSPELIVAIIAENKELSRIVTASIRTARSNISAAPSDEN